MKILIVEDDPFVAEDLKEKLEKLQHRVTGIAECYDTGLASVREIKPDLVLLDIELKGALTGIDLSEQLNKQGIPFLYLSGLRELETYYKANSTGPLKNLAKPIDHYNLRNALLDIETTLTTTTQEETMHFFHDKNGLRKRVEPEQIVYMKAARSYCEVYFTDGTKWLLSKPMGTVSQELNYLDLIQISRFYVVNCKHIQQIKGSTVQLIVGPFLKVSETYREAFNQRVKKV
jgi:DNA-binding LytR/AlgR family response regulator